ncbi:MAG: thiamine biosynthesis lipoprotein [Verrucomicrobiales bacterium]|jgi:thiamine biosynthesis lipoprotein
MKRGREELIFLAALFVFALSACGADQQLLQFRDHAMGTTFLIRVYAEDGKAAEKASKKVMERVRALEAIFSDYDGDSEVLRFCHHPPGTRVKLSPELYEVLTKAQELAEHTDGAFDVTIGTLIHLWRRADRDQELPDENDLKRAFAQIGRQHLKLNPDGTGEIAIDQVRVFLGGIAKGYAADEGLKIMREAGFPRCIVAASGDIAVGDPPPGETGWRIGITSLNSPDEPDRFVRIANAGVSTSGDSQQYLELDGERYSHIVDPQTGLGLTHRRSVTVIAPDAMTTDSLATALSVLGPNQQLLEKYPGSTARIVDEEAELFLGEFEASFDSESKP